MNIVEVRNLKWADAAQTCIDLEVKFEEIGEFIPFTADPNDPEEHGVELYNDVVKGDYGTIVAFSSPAATVGQIKAEAHKRIEAAMPAWMVALEVSGVAAITQTIKDYAAAILTESATLEGTLPVNYTDDSHWTDAP